jgi:hypothetical protein
MRTQTAERRLLRRDSASGEPSRRQLEMMIVGTYRDMAGLSLHLGQAARLFGLRVTTCEVVFRDLVERGMLRRAADGQFVRSEGTR